MGIHAKRARHERDRNKVLASAEYYHLPALPKIFQSDARCRPPTKKRGRCAGRLVSFPRHQSRACSTGSDRAARGLERRGVPDKAMNVWIGNTARLRSKRSNTVRAEDWAAVTAVAGSPASIPAQSRAVRSRQCCTTLAKNRWTCKKPWKISAPDRNH